MHFGNICVYIFSNNSLNPSLDLVHWCRLSVTDVKTIFKWLKHGRNVSSVDRFLLPHTTALKEVHIKALSCTRDCISVDQTLPFQINVN